MSPRRRSPKAPHAIVRLEHDGERVERAWTVECRCGWVDHDCSTRALARGEHRFHAKNAPAAPTLTIQATITKADIEAYVAGEVATYESLPGLWTVALHRLAICHEKTEEDARHTASMIGNALHNSIVEFLKTR